MTEELSIIIPTLNEEHYLPKLLTSIADQDFKGTFEVIVVDGKSTDKTKAIATSFKNKIKNLSIIESSRGIAKQRNIGSTKARFDNLVFLDADTILTKRFLSTLVNKISHNKEENYIMLPLILPLKGTFFDYILIIIAYFFFFLVSFWKPITAGVGIITSKKNHRSIGGFNEQAIYAEDIDYGLRSKKAGARYHLYLSLPLYSSTRRKKGMGSIKLGLLWLNWYIQTVRSGEPITDESKYNYSYGSHEANK